MNDDTATRAAQLSIFDLLAFMGRNVLLIGTSTLLCGVAAAALAFSMRPLYRAEIIVSSPDNVGTLGELGGQLGGLASLAGIAGGGGSGKKWNEALEYLRSRAFTARFIQKHDLMPVMYYQKWDAVNRRWRDPGPAPTLAEAVSRFGKKVRQIAEDRRTNIATVAIIWPDRVAAAQLANAMIAEADADLRHRAIEEQDRSVEYLKNEAQHTSTVEISTAISKVMETELKNAMLARTRDAYAFRVLDPAVAPDANDRDSPNKPLIVAAGLGIGLLLGMLIAIVRAAARGRR
ncbi:MAG TPA: Wzz/FepE/Etk N-terminal domain-containing protein [Steroidobacteraceae bacterium]|nr:Wzz/FepE/Etk N-terminal domain-containing protein [Steroidobacteraceae bacterium]